MMFGRLLDISSDARPKNPGSLVAQLRDLDQLRELLTSTTLGVLLDLPFAVVFLFIIWFLGGWMVCVPLAAIPLVLLPGLLAQLPLAKLSRAGMNEAALRNSVLMESIYRIDDIKTLQAEERFTQLWQRTNDVGGAIGLRQRFYRALFANWAQTVQQVVYAATLVFGAYAIIEGNLSFGVLTACSMLSTRAIAPLAQIASVLSVLQNARVGKAGLDSLMKLPTDHDTARSRYHRRDIRGAYLFENAVYAYDGAEKPALVVPALKIKGGDHIALLGRAGSGKSTLLRLLSGLSKPGNGRILLDNTNLELIDRGDLRKAVGLLMQDSGLFFGTLRENLAIASPSASDEDMLMAMKVACADELLLNQQHGLDLVIRENGVGLSGGQRQVLLLARVILRNPKIVLLDEPTASLDEATERKIVGNLAAWGKDRTMVIATHRYPILDLATRVIVLDGGRVAADGPRDDVIAKLRVA
jgi:ATP-binding cassette, subfamily C, bacterial LapB